MTEKELIKELAITQEKLKAINSLTNCMANFDSKTNKNIAYLIHQIIESDCFNSDLARQVLSYKIISKKDLFINI